MTQADRLARWLDKAGPHGTTQVDWLRAPTPDGGPPITRVAARMEELRKRGMKIRTLPERRDACVVYVWDRDESQAIVASVLGPAPRPEPDAPAQLFAGVEVGRGQRSAIYDDDMGAAA